MFKLFHTYRKLPRHLLYVIGAQFFLQLINTSFFLILNFYMTKAGYNDPQIADFLSFRFLAVMLFAFPLGLYIKGQKLHPFFYFAAFLVPTMALAILYGIASHTKWLIYASLTTWGIAFATMQVAILPYILRNTHESMHSETITLSYSTWSVSTFTSGLLIFLLSKLHPSFFTERNILVLISVMGFISPFLLARIKRPENIPDFEGKRFELGTHQWGLIFNAVVPTMIIAVGAGLTIPFINLFFYHIFDVDYNVFSLLGTGTTILVALVMLTAPIIKKRFGYKVGITLSQGLAVVALVLLASTEYYRHWFMAVYIAVICYMVRQPLMNLARPMTSELSMYYVGQQNQEILSALMASIWSGSWFFSSQIFRMLRAHDFHYSTIFLITAGFYTVGVVWYYFLINHYRKRKRAGLVE